jgi:DNA-binding transcriptional ArsR family regulator
MTSVLVDQTLTALADPTRLRIVQRLSDGPASVSELADPFAMSLRGVLQHVQVLEEAGIVATEKVGRVRRCRIRPEPIDELTRWLDDLRTRWERRIDRIEAYVTAKEEQ